MSNHPTQSFRRWVSRPDRLQCARAARKDWKQGGQGLQEEKLRRPDKEFLHVRRCWSKVDACADVFQRCPSWSVWTKTFHDYTASHVGKIKNWNKCVGSARTHARMHARTHACTHARTHGPTTTRTNNKERASPTRSLSLTSIRLHQMARMM